MPAGRVLAILLYCFNDAIYRRQVMVLLKNILMYF
jgi:hypothetical protein